MTEPRIAGPPPVMPSPVATGVFPPDVAGTTAVAPGRPWGFWATLGWTLLIAIAYLMVATGVVAVFGIWQMLAQGTQEFPSPKDFETNGLVAAVAGILTTPVAAGIAVLFAYLRKGISVTDYLGLRWPGLRRLAFWCVALLALLVLNDVVSAALGRPLVPEVMIAMYRRAQILPLFWVAVVIAAPVSEEIVFRGFLFTGLEHSRVGPWPTVFLTAALWAIIHVQYDVYGMSAIFTGGILLGWARLKTGSVLLCMLLHGIMNLIATIEVAVHISLSKP